ncbi:unnamed protein product [Linum trigynum]|uniref:Uncharacterized protein n=1 Tax=Linum trigynum TaxID=586398 RepID=A0AAV2F1L4_9ROSI
MPTATPDLHRAGCPHRPAAPAVPAIMIEIYAAAWLRDVQIGSIRVLISNVLIDVQIVPLQIRRPSGRPQGILNMGVQLLDNTMRSMPLYTELSASGGFNNLLDAKTTAGGAKNLEEKTANASGTNSYWYATTTHWYVPVAPLPLSSGTNFFWYRYQC